jgi:hypothetical protein
MPLLMLFCLLFSEWSDKHIRPYSMAHAFIHFLDYSLTKLLLQLPRHTRSMDMVWKYIYLRFPYIVRKIYTRKTSKMFRDIFEISLLKNFLRAYFSFICCKILYFKVNTSVNNLRFFTDQLSVFVSLFFVVSDCPFKAPMHKYN